MHVFSRGDVGLDPLTPFNLRRHRVTERIVVPTHRHGFTEISITLAGGAVHHHGRDRQRLGPGSVLIVHRPEAHGFSQTKDWEMWDLFFLSEWMEIGLGALFRRPDFFTLFYEAPGSPTAELGGVRHFRLGVDELAVLRRDLESFATPPLLDPEMATLWRTNRVVNLLAVLAAAFAQRHPRSLRAFPTPLTGALSWIDERLEAPKQELELGLRSLLGVSERQVRRLFAQYLNETPGAYLMRRKLRRAAADIRLSGALFTEIAQRFGFFDASHFSRAFRSEFGMAPQAYRSRFIGRNGPAGPT